MPRIGSPTTGRPDYYDRDPSQQVAAFDGTIVEDTAETQRITTTAAANRKIFIALLTLAPLVMTPSTSTTDTDRFTSFFDLTPSGGVATQILTAFLPTEAAVQGNREHVVVSPFAMLLPGDQLEGKDFFSGDNAGAGRVRSTITRWGVAFDA